MSFDEKKCFIYIVCQNLNVRMDDRMSLWKLTAFSCVIELNIRHGRELNQDIVDRMHQTTVNEASRGYYYLD